MTSTPVYNMMTSRQRQQFDKQVVDCQNSSQQQEQRKGILISFEKIDISKKQEDTLSRSTRTATTCADDSYACLAEEFTFQHGDDNVSYEHEQDFHSLSFTEDFDIPLNDEEEEQGALQKHQQGARPARRASFPRHSRLLQDTVWDPEKREFLMDACYKTLEKDAQRYFQERRENGDDGYDSDLSIEEDEDENDLTEHYHMLFNAARTMSAPCLD